MSIFNPDKVFASLVNAMGLQPQQIQTFVTEIVNELRIWKAEREAFKPAAARAYQDIVNRLEIQDRKIDALTMMLHVRPSGEVLKQLNGEIQYVGHHVQSPGGTDGGGGSISEQRASPEQPVGGGDTLAGKPVDIG